MATLESLLIKVGIDPSDIKPGMTKVGTEVKRGASKIDGEVPVTVDDSKVKGDMAGVASMVESRARSINGEVPVTVDGSKAESGIAGVVSKVESKAKGASPTITPEVDDSKAESGMDNLMGSLKDKAKTGGAAVGALIAASMWEAMSSESAIDLTSAQLGLSPKQSARAGRVAGEVFANNWSGSISEAAGSVAAVMSSIPRMRIAGDEDLERITSKAAFFADLVGTEVPQAAQIAGQLVRTGLAKNADQAFDLLTASSQQVPIAVREDLLDAADEYGPFFAGLGISGEAAFSMLVKGAEKGMYGIDKTGDAIKELTIRATDMSTTSKAAYKTLGLDADTMADDIASGGDRAKGAFDKIVTGLLSIKDPQKRANTAIALFGTPLEDLAVGEIPQFLRGLRSMDGQLGKLPGTTNRAMTQMTDNVEGNLKTATNTMRLGAQDLIAGFLSGDWDRMGKGLTGIFNGLKSLYKKYWRQMLIIGTLGIGFIIVQIIDHWNKIKGFFSSGWKRVKAITKGAWVVLRSIVGGGLNWVKDKVGDAWNWVKDTTGNAWGKVKDVVGGAWDWIKSKISGVWNNGIKPVFNALKDGVLAIPGAFRTARNGIGEAWKKIKGLVRAPINFVINKVLNDGLISGFNWIADKIPGAPHIDPIPGLKRGGIYPGYTPGRDIGMIGVSGGEAVMRPEWTRAVGPKRVDEMNSVARSGGVQGVQRYLGGHADGGVVSPVTGYGATTHYGEAGPLWSSGYHTGTDFPAPTGTPVRAVMDGRIISAAWSSWGGNLMKLLHGGGWQTWYAHLAGFARRGGNVGAGDVLGGVGATGNTTGPHLHLELHAPDGSTRDPMELLLGGLNLGGAVSGGLMDIPGMVAGWIASLSGKAVQAIETPFKYLSGKISGPMGELGDSWLGRFVKAGPKNLVGKMAGYIKDLATDAGYYATGPLDIHGTPTGPVQKIIADLAGQRGWGSGSQWSALDSLITAESSWDPTAQNPTSSAYGLFQFLDSTWASVGGTKTSDPYLQGVYGLRYIAQRYGDPMGAWGFHQANNWYGNGLQGGIFTKPTLIGVGDKGPERVDVTPLHGSRGADGRSGRFVLEGPMSFSVDGHEFTGMVRGIAREEIEDESAYQSA